MALAFLNFPEAYLDLQTVSVNFRSCALIDDAIANLNKPFP